MKNKVIYIVIIIVTLITFSLMYEKQDVFNRAIVVGMGLDSDNQGVNVCIEYLKQDKYLYFEGYGTNIEEAISNMEKELGIVISLSQTEVIVFGKTQNICKYFDELVKKNMVVFNVIILASDNAQQLICSSKENKESVSSTIMKISQKNDKQVLLKDYLLAKNVSREMLIPTIVKKDESFKIDSKLKLFIDNNSV